MTAAFQMTWTLQVCAKRYVIRRAGPGQFAALGNILPGAPCLRLVNIN